MNTGWDRNGIIKKLRINQIEMQKFEPQSVKRSESSAKTIHNLKPSILSRSNSHSSLFQNKRFNSLIQSTDQSTSKLSPVKVHFTYTQLTARESNSVPNWRFESQKIANKPCDPKQELKNEKKTFLNVISKQSLPLQVITFVYGNYQSDLSKYIVPISSQTYSIRTPMQKSYHLNHSNHLAYQQKQFEDINSQLIDDPLIDKFPSSKVKKSRKTSTQRSTQSKVQLPQNRNKQIPSHQIHPFTDDVLQQIKELKFNERTCSQNENEPTETFQQKSRGTSQQLTWNHTIKLNELFPQSQLQKQKISNTESTANQSFQQFIVSQTNEKDNIKNQTQKISEFLLCDEEILSSPKVGVPIFEVKLSDLRKIHEEKASVSEKDHQNLNPFTKKREENQQSDKLGENLDVLGTNINELSKTIKSLSFRNEFIQFAQNFQQKSKSKSHESAKQQEKEKIHHLNLKQSSMSQQKTVQLTIIVDKSKQLKDKKKNTQVDHKKHQQQKIQMTIVAGETSQKIQLNVKEFIPCKQHQINAHSSDFLKPTDKSKNFDQNLQKIQISKYSENQTDQEFIRTKRTMMGSLQVVEIYNQPKNLQNSLQHIYSIPEDSLQLSPEPSKIILNHDNGPTNSKYPDSLFPQNFELKTQLNIKRSLQTKQTPSKSGIQTSPSRSSSKYNPILQKSYQKRQKNHENSKITPFQVSLQRAMKNHNNHLSTSKDESIEKNITQRYTQNENQSQKHELNYEMYKTYRNKSVSKHYTKVAIDENKSRVIELPLMQAPVQFDGSKIIYPKYIKNKVYYVKG